jgi:predicted transcriptional regulator/KaiC/GvpD/RAD55 family RecA-like ATPase
VESLAKRRTKYEIYAELLDIVARRGSCRLTRASYGANLPVDRAKKTMTFLASRGFLKEERVEDSSAYRITKRGLEFIDTFRQMRKLFAALDERTVPSHPGPKEPYERGKLRKQVAAQIRAITAELKVDKKIDFEIQVQNPMHEPIFLTEVMDFPPPGFELISKPSYCSFEGTYLKMNKKRIEPVTAEKIGISLKTAKEGTYVLKARILFEDQTGSQQLCELEPTTIDVSGIDVTGRISTGYKDLDNLLLGGIPENYAVILTSISSDERDLLIRKFLEAGVKNSQTTFYVTVEAREVENLVEDFQSDFHLFICNPQAATMVRSTPNVHRLKGVENLTDINIALTSAFRTLGQPTGPRRACIEIISDVLLQHHAIQTRRWLSGLMPELRARGFTTLAVMNPHMHPPEEVHAILGLFNGEMNIFEKETGKGPRKHLRIKKMYNQRYLENEMPLVKTKLLQ